MKPGKDAPVTKKTIVGAFFDLVVLLALLSGAFAAGYYYALHTVINAPKLDKVAQAPALKTPPLKTSAAAITSKARISIVDHDHASTKTVSTKPKLPAVPKPRVKHTGKPVKFEKKKVDGVSLYQTTIDLTDADSFVDIMLANKAAQANSAVSSSGDETFDSFVKRCNGAVLVNGTFFSKDDQKRVMGNMVAKGHALKYSQWENYGTTLGLRADNIPEMITARDEEIPDWSKHWFSITCGPRLLKHGDVWVYPEKEGFSDSHVLGIGPRAAIGFSKGKDKLYLVTFLSGLSLPAEAKLMQAIGCFEAMNLDGGASRALAREKSILVPPGRPLTNVLIVYDVNHPAPQTVVDSWKTFTHPGVVQPAGSEPSGI